MKRVASDDIDTAFHEPVDLRRQSARKHHGFDAYVELFLFFPSEVGIAQRGYAKHTPRTVRRAEIPCVLFEPAESVQDGHDVGVDT